MVENLYGIYIALPLPNFIINLEALGAYISLGNGGMMRLYFFKSVRIDNPEVYTIFQTFADEKRDNFSITHPLAL